jgi:hypothetical protein
VHLLAFADVRLECRFHPSHLLPRISVPLKTPFSIKAN